MPVSCAQCGSFYSEPHESDITLGDIQRTCPQCGAALKRPISPRERHSRRRTVVRVAGILFSSPEAWFFVFLMLMALGYFLK